MGDLMILIAAIGAGMAGSRQLWLGLLKEWPSLRVWWYWTAVRLVLAMMLSAWATPLTLACLAFGIRRPRPAWRRVALRPGTAAALACSLVFAARTLETVVVLETPAVRGFLGVPPSSKSFHIRFNDSSHIVFVKEVDRGGIINTIEPEMCFGIAVAGFATPCGYAVAAVWLVLAISGRWRPEESWIDRLGRALGVTWIAITILAALPLNWS